MFPNPRREVAVLISAICMCGSAYAFSAGSLGCGGFLMGVSLWVILSCEALQLVRIHTEMASMIDKLRQKQSEDTVGILSFLKDASIAEKPFQSVASAIRMAKSMGSTLPVLVSDDRGNCCTGVVETCITYASQGWADIMGWDPEDLLGKNPMNLSGPEVQDDVSDRLQQAYHEKKKMVHSRWSFQTANGALINGFLTASFITTGGIIWLFHPDKTSLSEGM